ncbi:MAG: Gfo/Idh/MocA family oxidoreductase [Planctomycetota bacterium]|nr:Gfo/Idh/MocA family oxidoreductase [Planctomycetota bacterium]
MAESGKAGHRAVVVGVGSIGERHLRCFKATGRVEAGFVEINPALRKTIAERYSVGPLAFDSLDAALAHKLDGGGFNVGVVCTPAPYHLPIASQMLRAGMHVLIEKPLSTSLDGVDDLRKEIERSGKTVGVAYVLRTIPSLAAMRQAILSGRFGRPVEVLVASGQHFPFFRPAYRDIYYKDRKTGGGAIQDAITHMVNAVEWIVGPADRLIADAAHLVLEGVTVEDTVHVVTRHGGVMGCLTLNQHQMANETSITVNCTGGTVRWEIVNNRWRWTTRPDEPWHDEDFPPAERDTHFINQAHAFLDAVEGKRPVLCTFDEGVQTLKVNLAMLASSDAPPWRNVN